MSRFDEPVFGQIGPPLNMTADEVCDISQPLVIDKRRVYDQTWVGFNHVPLGDYLVVKRLPEEEGLIVEADIAKQESTTCEIIAVSPYAQTEYGRACLLALHSGDKILIRRHSGTDIKLDGIEYTLIFVFDVLLKLGEKSSQAGAIPSR